MAADTAQGASALAYPSRAPIVPGTVDTHSRPIHRNPDGSYSTLLSMSYGTPQGERLVPTVAPDGHIMSDDEAEQESARTGQHLGIYGDHYAADAAAQRLHDEGDAEYGARVRADPTLTRTDAPLPQMAAPSPAGLSPLPQGPGASPISPQPMAPPVSSQSIDARFAALGRPSPQIPPEPPLPAGQEGVPPPAPDVPAAQVAEADPVRARLGGKPPADAAREAASGPLPRLDAGLPTEAEIASHRDDPFMSILHGLQNGLLGAIGRPRRDFGEQADALAAERRTGLRAAMAGKAGERASDRTAMATAEHQAEQTDIVRQRLGLQARDTAARERTADALTPARVAQIQAQTGDTIEHTTGATEARTEADDPQSPQSVGTREGIETRLGEMLPADRERVLAANPDLLARLPTMPQSALAPILASLPASPGHAAAGRRAGGGGGGGGTLTGARRDSVLEEMQAVLPGTSATGHMTLAEAERHLANVGYRGARGVSAELHAHGARSSAGESVTERMASARTEIMPGVFRTVQASPTEDAGLRTAFRTYSASSDAIATMERVAREHGRATAISPAASAEMAAARSALMALDAQVEHSGVINEAAVPRISAAIPDPSTWTAATFGTLPLAARAWREALRSQVDAAAHTYGIDGAGYHSAVAISEGRQSPVSPGAGAVRMRFPDGSVRSVPSAMLEEARRVGAEAAP